MKAVWRNNRAVGATPASPFARWARRATQASPRRIALIPGCYRDDRADDAHAKPLEAAPFFSDGMLARPLINGTVPRAGRVINDPMYAVTAPDPAMESASFPAPISADDLARGQR